MKSHVLLVLLAALVLSGCSTLKPYHSGRKGLLDRERQAAGRVSRTPAVETSTRARSVATVNMKGLRPQWPLRNVSVTSHYGPRGSDFHEGIDLRAPAGTPVHAVEAGIVLYADQRIRGYGKMIVLRHANGLSTVYAHNSRLLVRRGQPVKRGQKLARSGSSGRATGPHLHFEVRKGTSPVDPARVLPKQTRWVVDAKPSRKTKLMKVAAREVN